MESHLLKTCHSGAYEASSWRGPAVTDISRPIVEWLQVKVVFREAHWKSTRWVAAFDLRAHGSAARSIPTYCRGAKILG